jgi:ATP-binding cassette subfamily F protein uup
MVGDRSVHVIRYMKDFLFLPEQARTPIHALSGGERGRLQLARGLRLPSNFLVLDEPTNDLDLETLDLLQELVADYNGTVVVVSHDRDFLDRTVTRTIGFEGDAQWQSYAGGYTDMINQRGHGVQQRKKAEKEGRVKVKSGGDAAPQKGKLSYKHKFRLEQLPAEMAKHEADIKDIEAILADPNLFSSDPDAFNKAISDLDVVKTKLEACEEEWMELEMLKESAG